MSRPDPTLTLLLKTADDYCTQTRRDQLTLEGAVSRNHCLLVIAKETMVPLIFVGSIIVQLGIVYSLRGPSIAQLPRICVSPDYVLVHEDAEQQLIEALKAAVARMTPENSEKLGKATEFTETTAVSRIISV